MVYELIANPIFTILSFILAVISIKLAFIFYFKGKRVKAPLYHINSYNIISKRIKKNKKENR